MASVTEIRINQYVINFSRGEILDLSVATVTHQSVEPKVLAVLKVLVEAYGQVVSQQQLLDDVWQDVVVTPNTLQRCIAQLRKLLGDNAKAQSVIKTHSKLGYSINVSTLSSNTVEESVEESAEVGDANDDLMAKNYQYAKRHVMAGSAFLIFLALCISVFFSNAKFSKTLPALSEVKPFSTDGVNVLSAVASSSGQFLVLAKEAAANSNLQDIKLKYLSQNEERLLVESVNVFGSLAISPNEQFVLYGRQTLQQDTTSRQKCIQLVLFHLGMQNERTLTPCSEAFSHSAIWLNDEKVMFISQQRDGSKRLGLVTLSDSLVRYLDFPDLHFSSLSYQKETQKLAWLASGNQVKTATLDLKGEALTHLISGPTLPTSSEHTVLTWHDRDTLVAGSNNQIVWLDKTQVIQTQQLATTNQIRSLIPFKTNQGMQYLTLLNKENRQGRARTWSRNGDNIVVLDTDIAPSVYEDAGIKLSSSNSSSNGNSDDKLGFISNRSGSHQVWTKNHVIKQVTHHTDDIQTFEWINESNSLLFLSEQKLWQQIVGQQPQQLSLSGDVNMLYQVEHGHALINIEVDGNAQLWWLNLDDLSYQSLNQRDMAINTLFWAQRVNDTTILTTSQDGKLVKWENGVIQPITALPEFTVQWRFVVKTHEGNRNLYVQDKLQRVWQYNPENETAHVVGMFDENALFMTDFDPKTTTMYTDNYVSKQAELVWLLEAGAASK